MKGLKSDKTSVSKSHHKKRKKRKSRSIEKRQKRLRHASRERTPSPDHRLPLSVHPRNLRQRLRVHLVILADNLVTNIAFKESARIVLLSIKDFREKMKEHLTEKEGAKIARNLQIPTMIAKIDQIVQCTQKEGAKIAPVCLTRNITITVKIVLDDQSQLINTIYAKFVSIKNIQNIRTITIQMKKKLLIRILMVKKKHN